MSTVINVLQFHAAIAAVCPILGVDANGTISFSEEASEVQKAAAQAVAATYLVEEPLRMAREAANAPIMAQIQALETQVTPRRQREAILGIDGEWLSALDRQIAVLRARLSS